MKCELNKTRVSRKFLICLFATVFLISVRAQSYDVICPDSDNPLNIAFKAPREILYNGPSIDIGVVAIDFLDPRDVACNANYEDVTMEMFKGAVACNLHGPRFVKCTVNEKCTAQRKETLLRLKEAVLKVLDEVVLKMNGIGFFNLFNVAKPVFFGTERLSNLTGLQIVKRVTNNEVNIVNGFLLSSPFVTFKGKDFVERFGKAIDLYARLKAAEDPTGRFASRNFCILSVLTPYVPFNELDHCYDLFFSSFKQNKKLDLPDQKLIALLEEALKYIVNDLSEGKKQFGELKLPFIGHCIGSDGMAPTSPYMHLLKHAEIMKNV